MNNLNRETFIPASIDRVFDFFCQASNLNQITPPWLHFKILYQDSKRMERGTRIDYSIRLHGIPLTWKTQIVEWEPPHQFVDFQLKGPYKYWRHTHRFLNKNDGTLMQDIVDYVVPGKFFEPLLHALFVKKDLERIFDYREKKFSEIFSTKAQRGTYIS